MTRSLAITVMSGGTSAEREVSLRSGAAVVNALGSRGHRVYCVDPQDAAWELPRDTEVVFLALHGTYGEDGQVQSQLEEIGVPYTGCNAESSRIAFDKVLTKERCIAAGVATPRHAVVLNPSAAIPDDCPPPWVMKPVRQGSSVGLEFVEGPEDWRAALDRVLQFDREVLVEQRIRGREATVGILDGVALPVVEIRPRQGSYDYRNKYTAGLTEYLCPAPWNAATTVRIQEMALKAFEAVQGRDYGRVDVMVDEQDQPWLLEVNTLPGMTETSLLPKAAAAAGLDFASLCQRMIDMAMRRAR
jgi:D-alanine-D-alanine ligase